MKADMNALRNAFGLRVRKDAHYRHWVLTQLYGAQTADEQAEEKTKHDNEMGFTTPDAPILTGLAEKLLSGEKLSPEEERELRLRLPKYWGQFTKATLVEATLPVSGRAA